MALRFGIPAEQYNAMGADAQRAQRARHNAVTQGAGGGSLAQPATPELSPYQQFIAAAAEGPDAARAAALRLGATGPGIDTPSWMRVAGPQGAVDNRVYRDPTTIPPPPKDPERLAAYYRSKAYHDAWNRWFEVMKSRNFIDPHLYPPPEPGDYTGVGGG